MAKRLRKVVLMKLNSEAGGKAELYSFEWTEETVGDVLKVVGRWAADPELTFNWSDAGIVLNRIQKKLAEGRRAR